MLKRLVLISVCCIYATVAGAQNYQVYRGDTINRKDAKGLKQAVWRKYYRTDTLCSETVFKDDKPIGISRTWFESGKLKAVVTFDKTNPKQATIISYYESGKVLAKGFYNNQKKDSVWIYYGENDSVKTIEYYKNTLPDKTWKVFYENGKLAEETPYQNGKKEGMHKEYNDDDTLIFEMPYKNDRAEGVAKLYYRNGKLRASGQYHNGLREGVWTYYDTDGIKQRESHYKNGMSKDKAEPENK